ncbi:citrate synthase/methylcitrate synthase [Mesorhizobium sp. ASY16-5R]|uniref:citrate synthase/methylcitrate synthase n=1 Tax=Mesorhizobium sp. ASY16-5R TaxID=3445772 RepID=UPI003F9FA9E4
MTIHQTSTAGLDGVSAAVTMLSHVDGEAGELIIAGSRVDDLAATTSFEGVVARLWSAAGAATLDEAEVRVKLAEARLHAFRRLAAILPATDGLSIVDGFRAAVAAIGPQDGIAPEAMSVGAMPVLAAALVRRAAGQAAVAPDASLGHAADTLKMLRGEAATGAEAKALDAYLVTVSDHGMNASTFAARVVASTQADLFMVVTAAYCALSGPLHGGAPGPVLDMLDAIGTSADIAPWVDAALARGDRLMGFGHRIYKVRDPRADVLKRAVDALGGDKADLGLTAEVEAYAREALAKAKPGRRLDTNVEFYTAILLDALKIPRNAFTPIFAAGRSAGWTAHAIEQQRTGRLLRPTSVYAGPMPA